MRGVSLELALRGALPGHCLYRATFQILAKRRDAFARVRPAPAGAVRSRRVHRHRLDVHAGGAPRPDPAAARRRLLMRLRRRDETRGAEESADGRVGDSDRDVRRERASRRNPAEVGA